MTSQQSESNQYLSVTSDNPWNDSSSIGSKSENIIIIIIIIMIRMSRPRL